jgi:hypothetical protein
MPIILIAPFEASKRHLKRPPKPKQEMPVRGKWPFLRRESQSSRESDHGIADLKKRKSQPRNDTESHGKRKIT